MPASIFSGRNASADHTGTWADHALEACTGGLEIQSQITSFEQEVEAELRVLCRVQVARPWLITQIGYEVRPGDMDRSALSVATDLVELVQRKEIRS